MAPTSPAGSNPATVNTIENFIDSIHRPHLDNAQNVYMAKKVGHGAQHSVSPLTNFVFEFFLFNSLYSIDWFASMEKGDVIEHARDHADFKEDKQQREFVKFCRKQFKNLDPSKIADAFLPLAGLENLSSDWTTVTPDSRICAEDGVRFFSKIKEIGELATRNELKANKTTFDLIDKCCYFVYLVRNNIFHGAKSLGEVYEVDQARRIAVYDLFVRCLNSLFFLAFGKSRYGSSYAQLPIIQNVGDHVINLTLQDVYRALHRGLLKAEYSFLHWKLFRGNDPPPLDVNSKCALFYPTAGRDILFPLIVGLPYCTDFFFFEKHASIQLPIPKVLEAIGQTAERVDSGYSDRECHKFEIDSIVRRIWTMRKDNKTFLDLEIPLAFFFHRGDSNGEGGSGQRWDSDLFPHLIKRACSDVGLRIFTDGEPGGLDESVKSHLEHVSVPDRHGYRDYFSGVLRGTSLDAVYAAILRTQRRDRQEGRP